MEMNNITKSPKDYDFESTFSPLRMRIYLKNSSNNKNLAIEDYIFNLKLAQAFITPLDFMEISLRNAIGEVLTDCFGDKWYELDGFLNNLSSSRRSDLNLVINQLKKSKGIYCKDDVIANLNLRFWEALLSKKMFHIVWKGRLEQIFPHKPITLSEEIFLENLRTKLNQLRPFRNRIAHHEQILYKPNIGQRYTDCVKIVGYRSSEAKNILLKNQEVTKLLNLRRTRNYQKKNNLALSKLF